MEVSFKDIEKLATLGDWVFAEALGCGDNYDLRVESIEPGRDEPPSARAEAARRHRRFLFFEALERIVREGTDDLAFVVFECVNEPQKVVQFRNVEGSGDCEIVKWSSEKSASVLWQRFEKILSELGFTIMEYGNARLQVDFENVDDLWPLASLTERVFTEILDCGDFYEVDVSSASWFPRVDYLAGSLQWKFYQTLTRMHFAWTETSFVIFEAVNYPNNPVKVRYLKEQDLWTCEISVKDEAILAELRNLGFQVIGNKNPHVRIKGNRQGLADLLRVLQQVEGTTDTQQRNYLLKQYKKETDASDARRKLVKLLHWFFVKTLTCEDERAVIVKRASWRERERGYRQLFRNTA